MKLRQKIHWIRKKLRLESFQLTLFIVLLETIKVINFEKGEKTFLIHYSKGKSVHLPGMYFLVIYFIKAL